MLCLLTYNNKNMREWQISPPLIQDADDMEARADVYFFPPFFKISEAKMHLKFSLKTFISVWSIAQTTNRN